MIKPTVGRVVWFYPGVAFAAANNIAFGDPEQPLAATIAYVINDQMVNLSAVDQNGKQFNVTSVPLKQDDSDLKIGSYYCEWMPYQKEQAKLIEATKPFDLTELPELKVAEGEPPINERCCICSVGSASSKRDERLDNREIAYMLTQLLNIPNINSDLRRKAETKMGMLLDSLIPEKIKKDWCL